jgi:predicted Fe-S protein YdhL (DUF1289 family)
LAIIVLKRIVLSGNILRSSNFSGKLLLERLMADVVASPCIGICRLNAQKVCMGCGRTGNEIAEWLAASDARRMTIALEARIRLASLQPIQPVVSHE